MDELAAYLLEKESITGKEFMKIFNRHKGIEDEDPGEKKDPDGENMPDQAVNTEDKAENNGEVSLELSAQGLYANMAAEGNNNVNIKDV